MKQYLLKLLIIASLIFYYGMSFNTTFENIAVKISVAAALAAVVLIMTGFLFDSRQNHYSNDENHLHETVHDLKSPVFAQIRACELLLKGNFGQLKPTQSELIKEIHNSCKYLSELIGNILTSGIYVNTARKINKKVIEVNELVKECIIHLNYLSEDKRCKIIFESKENELYIEAGKAELKRVITNLIYNALTYSPTDSVVTVNVKADATMCDISVNNSGNIMSEKDLKEIFKKYKSLSGSGTGLGLYICDLILKKHNSKLIVQSNEADGNTFKFRIPVAKNIVLTANVN